MQLALLRSPLCQPPPPGSAHMLDSSLFVLCFLGPMAFHHLQEASLDFLSWLELSLLL